MPPQENTQREAERLIRTIEAPRVCVWIGDKKKAQAVERLKQLAKVDHEIAGLLAKEALTNGNAVAWEAVTDSRSPASTPCWRFLINSLACDWPELRTKAARRITEVCSSEISSEQRQVISTDGKLLVQAAFSGLNKGASPEQAEMLCYLTHLVFDKQLAAYAAQAWTKIKQSAESGEDASLPPIVKDGEWEASYRLAKETEGLAYKVAITLFLLRSWETGTPEIQRKSEDETKHAGNYLEPTTRVVPEEESGFAAAAPEILRLLESRLRRAKDPSEIPIELIVIFSNNGHTIPVTAAALGERNIDEANNAVSALRSRASVGPLCEGVRALVSGISEGRFGDIAREAMKMHLEQQEFMAGVARGMLIRRR